ncbi:hypothetical protein OFM39_30580, partial [Escherichia coli]|nr:hypothetical protein [Escherichia coli]
MSSSKYLDLIFSVRFRISLWWWKGPKENWLGVKAFGLCLESMVGTLKMLHVDGMLKLPDIFPFKFT